MSRERYAELCEEIRRTGARCKCCDVPLNYCVYWEVFRMMVNPLEEEAAYLDKNSK